MTSCFKYFIYQFKTQIKKMAHNGNLKKYFFNLYLDICQIFIIKFTLNPVKNMSIYFFKL